MPRPKRVPQRQCVGCREMKPKKELIRVVRSPDGQITVDPTGKKSGRGAYICPSVDCLAGAVKGKRLQRALEHPVPEGVLEAIREELIGRCPKKM
ncbi:MAG: YlxR family protein [Bacillota bacterium]